MTLKNRELLAEQLDRDYGERYGDQRWGTFDDLERLYGLNRSVGYYLISEGEIKSRLIRFKGSRGTGRRLIDFKSVETFLDSCPTATTKGITRRMRNAAMRSAAVRSAKRGRAR